MHAHTRTYTHTHTERRTHTHTYTHARMHARTHARIHKPKRAHTHTHSHTHAHIRSHTHAHTHAHTRTHTHTYMHAHVHTYTQKPIQDQHQSRKAVWQQNLDFILNHQKEHPHVKVRLRHLSFSFNTSETSFPLFAQTYELLFMCGHTNNHKCWLTRS